jgi:anthranilate phosphoribosyltransferase
VVHGEGGLDEISLAGPTIVAEVRDGTVRRFTVAPEEFGVEPALLGAVRGGTATENAALVQRILEGEAGPPRDIVVINAAAALVAAGISKNFRDGAEVARSAIDSGKACKTLASLKAFTNAA